MGTLFKDKDLLLGVTGGIAAYKAVELLRLLMKEGAKVWTVMTKAACEFVGPLTFSAISGNPVLTEMFHGEFHIPHITLAERARLVILAPATANIIGKMANGIADDILSTTLLAVRCPVIICPAMNVNMYFHPAVRTNLEVLRSRGIHIVEPAEGKLVCGWEGKGRLADLEDIMEVARAALTDKDLEGEHVLVTAGPVREALDPIRYITNHSSGKMGYSIARVAWRRGASVTLVSGPTGLRPPYGVKRIEVETVSQMREAVLTAFEDATIVIKAAAVLDFRPAEYSPSKIKKGERELLTLTMERTPDILAELGRRKEERLLVGFAAETGDPIPGALEKMEAKNLDLVVANDVTQEGAGFQADTNIVRIIHRDGRVEELPLMDKEDVAMEILDRVVTLKKGR